MKARIAAIAATVVLSTGGLLYAAGFDGSGFPGGGAAAGAISALYCRLSGCTMTGQAVFCNVSTDISTGTNEDLTIAPAGTGNVVFTIDTYAYLFDNASFKITSSANSNMTLEGSTTSTTPSFRINDNSSTQQAQFAYNNSAVTDADLQSKISLRSVTGKVISMWFDTDVASATTLWEIMDNGSGTGVQLVRATGDGSLRARRHDTNANCVDGAGAAACGDASAGSVVIDAASTTVVVSTTSVTASSDILLTFDSSLGSKLSVTCNTTYGNTWVSARTAGTSFTVTISAAPVTNPACLSFHILN